MTHSPSKEITDRYWNTETPFLSADYMRTSIESAGDQFVGFVPDYSNGQVIVIGRDNVVFIPFNLIEQVQPIERESAAPLTDDQFNELMAGGDLANILDRETDGS